MRNTALQQLALTNAGGRDPVQGKVDVARVEIGLWHNRTKKCRLLAQTGIKG